MKIGRNDRCPCGSGKKYKKCHLWTSLKSVGQKLDKKDYKLYLYDQHKTLFELNKELRDIIGEMINRDLPFKNSKHFLAGFALGKAYKTHGVVLGVCEDGYGEDAAVLVRTIFDLLINLLYITKDETEGRITRYLDHDWILRQKTYEYAKTKPELVKIMEERALNPLPTDTSPEEIEKRAKEAQEKHKYNNVSWSDKSIRAMSEEVGRLDAYLTVYRLQSQITHTATRVINDYVKIGKKGFTVEIGPSENWISESLVSVFDFLYSIAGEYDKMLELGFDKRLDAVAEKWVNQVDDLNKKK